MSTAKLGVKTHAFSATTPVTPSTQPRDVLSSCRAKQSTFQSTERRKTKSVRYVYEHVSAVTHRGQQRASVSLELEQSAVLWAQAT